MRFAQAGILKTNNFESIWIRTVNIKYEVKQNTGSYLIDIGVGVPVVFYGVLSTNN